MNCCRGSEAIIDEDVAAWNGTAILSSKNYGHKVLILTGIGHVDGDDDDLAYRVAAAAGSTLSWRGRQVAR